MKSAAYQTSPASCKRALNAIQKLSEKRANTPGYGAVALGNLAGYTGAPFPEVAGVFKSLESQGFGTKAIIRGMLALYAKNASPRQRSKRQ